MMLGPIVASPLCGVMAARWGWPSIFYSFGMAGVAMGAVLWVVGADRPSQHARISPEELAYIESAVNAGGVAPSTPKVLLLLLCCSALW